MVKFLSVLTLGFCLANAKSLHAQEMAKPLGRWERKVSKNQVTLVVEDNRLHIVCTGEKALTLHADYAMTRDGLIYGVVTSIECDEDEEAEVTRTLFDAPFCFRFRIDEAALIIHNMKAHGADSKDDMWNGRYRAVRSTIPRAIAPTSYDVMPPYLNSSASPNHVPPHPCPIAPSFSASKEGENHQPKNSKDIENIFHFFGFGR